MFNVYESILYHWYRPWWHDPTKCKPHLVDLHLTLESPTFRVLLAASDS